MRLSFREYQAQARAGGQFGKGAPSKKTGRAAMNQTEAAYFDHLLLLQAQGEILGAWFEPLKLKLGDNCTYTPDFLVLNAQTQILELHEVKGFWRDDARVKIKAAAAVYPFKFVAVQLEPKTKKWIFEYF